MVLAMPISTESCQLPLGQMVSRTFRFRISFEILSSFCAFLKIPLNSLESCKTLSHPSRCSLEVGLSRRISRSKMHAHRFTFFLSSATTNQYVFFIVK